MNICTLLGPHWVADKKETGNWNVGIVCKKTQNTLWVKCKHVSRKKSRSEKEGQSILILAYKCIEDVQMI